MQWRHRGLARILLEEGADVNARDLGKGYTAIHAAVSWLLEYMIPHLLELGARIDILDNEGKTPLELAKCLGKEYAVGVLQAAAAPETKTP